MRLEDGTGHDQSPALRAAGGPQPSDSAHVQAVGLRVTYLHRVGFAGLALGGCEAQDWAFLSPHEVDVCRRGGGPQHADTPKQGRRMHLGGRGRMRSSCAEGLVRP